MKKKLLVLCLLGIMLATAIVYAGSWSISVKCHSCSRTSSGTFSGDTYSEAREDAISSIKHQSNCRNNSNVGVMSSTEIK